MAKRPKPHAAAFLTLAMQLPHVVECKSEGRFHWEPIAAFNVDVIALRYATECKGANPSNAYRVTDYDVSGLMGSRE